MSYQLHLRVEITLTALLSPDFSHEDDRPQESYHLSPAEWAEPEHGEGVDSVQINDQP